MPVFDKNLMWHTTGNFTKTTTFSGLEIHGTPIGGLAAYLAFPSSVGTTNQINAAVYVSADDSTYFLASQYPGGAQSWAASTGKEMVIPFDTDKKYARLQISVVGSTGTPNFGVLQAGIVLGVGRDWNRSVSFE